jgi:hypothetical protein
MFGGYKELDSLQKDYLKGQKSWTKMNEKVNKQRIAYHQICAKQVKDNDDAGQRDEKIQEDKYKVLLDELQHVGPVYVGEMKRIHQKAQNIEKRKIQFIEDILSAYVAITDLSKYEQKIAEIAKLGNTSINMINAMKDLEEWDVVIGLDEPLSIPAFESYYDSLTNPNSNNNNNMEHRNSIISTQSDVTDRLVFVHRIYLGTG